MNLIERMRRQLQTGSFGLTSRAWLVLATGLAVAAGAALLVSFVPFIGWAAAHFVGDLAVLSIACVIGALVATRSRPVAFIAAPVAFLLVAGNTEWRYVFAGSLGPKNETAAVPKLALRSPPVLRLGGDLRPIRVARGRIDQACPELNAAGALERLVVSGAFTYDFDPINVARRLGAPVQIDHEAPDVRILFRTHHDPRAVRVELVTSSGSASFDYWRGSEDYRPDEPPPKFTLARVFRWIFTCNSLQQRLTPSFGRVLPSAEEKPAEAINAAMQATSLGRHVSIENAEARPIGESVQLGRLRDGEVHQLGGQLADRCKTVNSSRGWGNLPTTLDAKSGVVLSMSSVFLTGCIDDSTWRFVMIQGIDSAVWDVRVLDHEGQPRQVFFFKPPTSPAGGRIRLIHGSWTQQAERIQFDVLRLTDPQPNSGVVVERQTMQLQPLHAAASSAPRQ